MFQSRMTVYTEKYTMYRHVFEGASASRAVGEFPTIYVFNYLLTFFRRCPKPPFTPRSRCVDLPPSGEQPPADPAHARYPLKSAGAKSFL